MKTPMDSCDSLWAHFKMLLTRLSYEVLSSPSSSWIALGSLESASCLKGSHPAYFIIGQYFTILLSW